MTKSVRGVLAMLFLGLAAISSPAQNIAGSGVGGGSSDGLGGQNTEQGGADVVGATSGASGTAVGDGRVADHERAGVRSRRQVDLPQPEEHRANGRPGGNRCNEAYT